MKDYRSDERFNVSLRIAQERRVVGRQNGRHCSSRHIIHIEYIGHMFKNKYLELACIFRSESRTGWPKQEALVTSPGTSSSKDA